MSGERPGLYVHVPFCERACPYCDFDFEVARRHPRGGRLDPRIARFLDGISAELDRRGPGLEGDFDTLYVGGGTPSVLGPAGLAELEDRLAAGMGSSRLAQLREWTVELNPEHATAELLDALAERGVDRVSLGIQSLRGAGLRQLGRAHGRAEALAAIEGAAGRGLRVSVDLIVGWPGQSRADLVRDLDELLAAGVGHLSIYALTIEADTPWPTLVRRGVRELPDEDLQADLLCAVEEQLVARGFVHYEVASYCLEPPGEAIHNGKYWRGVDVIGLGPSAASVRHAPGRVERATNPRGLERWREHGFAGDGTQVEREELTGGAAAGEGLWLGLRRLRGIDVPSYLRAFAVERRWLEDRVRRQIELGNLEWARGGSVLRVSPGRWLWHDSIALDLIVADARGDEPA